LANYLNLSGRDNAGLVIGWKMLVIGNLQKSEYFSTEKPAQPARGVRQEGTSAARQGCASRGNQRSPPGVCVKREPAQPARGVRQEGTSAARQGCASRGNQRSPPGVCVKREPAQPARGVRQEGTSAACIYRRMRE